MSRNFILEGLLKIKNTPPDERDSNGILGKLYYEPLWTVESSRLFTRACESWPKYTGAGIHYPVPVPPPYKTHTSMIFDHIDNSDEKWSVWTSNEEYAKGWEELLDHMIEEVKVTRLTDMIGDNLAIIVSSGVLVSLLLIFFF